MENVQTLSPKAYRAARAALLIEPTKTSPAPAAGVKHIRDMTVAEYEACRREQGLSESLGKRQARRAAVAEINRARSSGGKLGSEMTMAEFEAVGRNLY